MVVEQVWILIYVKTLTCDIIGLWLLLVLCVFDESSILRCCGAMSRRRVSNAAKQMFGKWNTITGDLLATHRFRKRLSWLDSILDAYAMLHNGGIMRSCLLHS